MEKHQTEKIRKIKAIPDRRIDFYYRLLNGPEQLKRRKVEKEFGSWIHRKMKRRSKTIGISGFK